MNLESLRTDVLVIGTGIAGLSFALRVADFADVIMATKKERSDSATNYAQGGIASVLDPADSFEQHVADTLRAGAGLCRETVVRDIVAEGPQAVRDLIAWGVPFSRHASQGDDPLDLGLEGGHSRPRVVHAGDFTGREIEAALLAQAQAHPRIRILEHHIATGLLVATDSESGVDRCYGADVLARDASAIARIRARTVLLATGGAGRVYQHSTNPSIATGDGIALAWRAGARVANLEFMQFHPTSLCRASSTPFLISEAVRGEGGTLRNEAGEPFMSRYDERGDLAPRDVVARAIDSELKRSGAPCVHLDITHVSAGRLRERFPNIHERLRREGIDMATDLIPVVPAAHYLCGGVICDLEGCTDLNGLLVSGEVACTGMHGANRLASNSLLEAVVLSRRAASALAEGLPETPRREPDFPPLARPAGSPSGVLVAHVRRDITQIMWDYVGIVRSNERLDWAHRNLQRLRGEVEQLSSDGLLTYRLVELDNILTAATLMVDCAGRRKESRGLHYNTDYAWADAERPGTDTILQGTRDYVTA